jgi:thioredoxin-like negative regulator of GroEL
MSQTAPLHLSSEQALKTLVEGFVLEHEAVMVLFTEASCQVADAVEPRLERMARERFPQLHFTVVSRNDSPELTAQWNVFAFPTVITFFQGKEHSRFVRAFSLEVVAESIARPYELLFERS